MKIKFDIKLIILLFIGAPIVVVFLYLYGAYKIPSPGSNVPPAYCIASQLSALSQWQAATGALAGNVTFKNNSSAPCVLLGYPKIQLKTVGGKLSVQEREIKEEKPPRVVIAKDEQALVRFVWFNWCGAATGKSMMMSVILPNNYERMEIPVTKPSGETSTSTPRCDSQDNPSVISVSAFFSKTQTKQSATSSQSAIIKY